MPDYPLAERTPEFVAALKGITLDAVLEGHLSMQDLRVTAEALELQAQVAEAACRPQLAENLRRAAELVHVPEERILEIYNALRPGRASQAELLELADQLERQYQARRCAALIREAAS
jgi:propanediol dehydratase small subunit